MFALYLQISNWLKALQREEEGQTLTEYALILVLVAIAAIVVLTSLGTQITSVFSQITSALS